MSARLVKIGHYLHVEWQSGRIILREKKNRARLLVDLLFIVDFYLVDLDLY